MASFASMASFLFVLSAGSFLWFSNARTFYVGGGDGWTLNPSENYTHWAQRNRFLVNDSIVFKYKQGNDSVLVVNKYDYVNCNKYMPIRIFTYGNSTFKFDKSGPFFFISGNGQNCEKGQKLEVVVLSENHHSRSYKSPAPSPAPISPKYIRHTISRYNVLIASTDGDAPAPAPKSAASRLSLSSIMVIGYSFIVSYCIYAITS